MKITKKMVSRVSWYWCEEDLERFIGMDVRELYEELSQYSGKNLYRDEIYDQAPLYYDVACAVLGRSAFPEGYYGLPTEADLDECHTDWLEIMDIDADDLKILQNKDEESWIRYNIWETYALSVCCDYFTAALEDLAKLVTYRVITCSALFHNIPSDADPVEEAQNQQTWQEVSGCANKEVEFHSLEDAQNYLHEHARTYISYEGNKCYDIAWAEIWESDPAKDEDELIDDKVPVWEGGPICDKALGKIQQFSCSITYKSAKSLVEELESIADEIKVCGDLDWSADELWASKGYCQAAVVELATRCPECSTDFTPIDDLWETAYDAVWDAAKAEMITDEQIQSLAQLITELADKLNETF